MHLECEKGHLQNIKFEMARNSRSNVKIPHRKASLKLQMEELLALVNLSFDKTG